MIRISLYVIAIGVSLTAADAAFAWDQYLFGQYMQRNDSITLDAGNARDINANTHVIDPWPPYVGNRRIPADGERMSGAMERYRVVPKQPRDVKPIEPLYDRNIGVSGFGAGGGAGGGGGGR
jgi:hypothetical protein